MSYTEIPEWWKHGEIFVPGQEFSFVAVVVLGDLEIGQLHLGTFTLNIDAIDQLGDFSIILRGLDNSSARLGRMGLNSSIYHTHFIGSSYNSVSIGQYGRSTYWLMGHWKQSDNVPVKLKCYKKRVIKKDLV